MSGIFRDIDSKCCTDCLFDLTRSHRKQLALTFVYTERAYPDQSGTPMKRNLGGESGGDQIEYCVPYCKSLYTTGKEFPDSWITPFNSDYNVWYDLINESVPKSGDLDLTQYNPTVSNYYIDPATRVCFEGKYCYDCLVPKFPGYTPTGHTDTDTAIMKHSRGKLRIIELSDTNFGFSIVTNQKSELQFKTGPSDLSIPHVEQGVTRQSFGNFYVQNSDISKHYIYALHAVGSLTFEAIHTTTENIKAHVGYEAAVWWPVKNFVMFRQYDKINWDGYGLNSVSVEVSISPGSYTPEQQFEKFSTGPISIDGDLPLDAVFLNEMLVFYRKNTMDSKHYLTMYSWSPGHFRVEHETEITNANEVTSLVSFGVDKGVLMWHNTDKTGTLYKQDGSAGVTITVEITDSTLDTTWAGTVSPDFRLIQARSSPANPSEASAVYAFFTSDSIFTVTFDLANTKIVLGSLITLDSRMNLYQPLDIGHIYLSILVVHPCILPTSDTDVYTGMSVMFYKLGTASTTDCIQLSSTEVTFD